MDTKIVYESEYKGLKYWIKRVDLGNSMGWFFSPFTLDRSWLCGYVALPKGHPLYGKHYDDLAIECHGGLTYSKFEDNDWVIGFDCAHGGDESRTFTEEWLRSECESIIDQVGGKK